MDTRPSINTHVRHFDGSGSASHFLNNLNALCTLQQLDKHDNRSLKRKVAFFQLYLRGPARSWFDELDDEIKLTWEAVEEHFVNRFIIPNSENESDFNLVHFSYMYVICIGLHSGF